MPTLEQLEKIRDQLGRLLINVENSFPDNPEGTYPSDVEMTVRLAYTTAGRALKQARAEREVVS